VSNALRFLPRQLADHLVTRGVAMAVVGLVLMLPLLSTLHLGAHVTPEQVDLAFGQALRAGAPLLTLVATYGIVGADARQGFYRFLFSKPVSPTAYYASAFVVAGMSFVVVELVLAGVFALLVGPTWSTTVLLDAAVGFVLLGAIVFAFSRFTRLDWLVAILVTAVANFARWKYPPHDSTLGAVLNVIFPPTGTKTYFPEGMHPAWGPLAWALGYAAVMLAIGLSAVRFLELGSNR